jgi:hypothetical protein
MGKGGSTQQSVVQTDIPEYAKPYYLDIMDRATAASKDDYVEYKPDRLAGINEDIRASRGMIRDISARGMPATDLALQGTKELADTAFNLGQQDPYRFSAASFTEQSADPYAGFRQTGVTGYGDFEAAKFKDLSKLFREGDTSRFGGFRAGRADPYAGFSQYGGFEAGRATRGRLSDAGTATAADLESYMDPYSELVTEQLTKKLRKEAGKSAAERGARAASAGAFGGSRQAVMEGIAEDELLDRIASVEAEQSSKAFQDARAAFEADRTARMNVEQARLAERARAQGINIQEAARVQQAESAEAARFQEAEAAELARTQGINIEEARRVQQDRAAEFARAQGLSLQEAGRVQAAVAQEKARIQGANASEFARIQESQAQELARVQGISVEEAARIQASEAQELARVQGISIDEAARVQAANAAERARVQAAQAAENMAQREFQLSTLGFTSDQLKQMSALEDAARAGDIQAAQLLETIGAARRADKQAQLDIDYQDFLRQQNYEKQQVSDLMGIMRGVPIGQTQTTFTPYNPIQQALGAGISALGLYKGLYG